MISTGDPAPVEVRASLIALASRQIVVNRQDKADGKPRRVYFITGEGKRKAGVNDARA